MDAANKKMHIQLFCDDAPEVLPGVFLLNRLSLRAKEVRWKNEFNNC